MRTLRSYRYDYYLFTCQNLSIYLFVCLPIYLSRWYRRMDLLKGGELTMRGQPRSCSLPTYITVLICFYGNTVCPPPSTHTQQPAVTLTATGSTGALLQGLVKVITPVQVRKPCPSPVLVCTDTTPVVHSLACSFRCDVVCGTCTVIVMIHFLQVPHNKSLPLGF